MRLNTQMDLFEINPNATGIGAMAKANDERKRLEQR